MTHFEAFYFGAALGAAVALAVARRWVWMCIALALSVAHGASVLMWYLPASAASASRGAAVTVMTANVHTENTNHAAFVSMVRAAKPDILAIEEVSDAWLRDLAPLHELYPYRVERPREDNFGIALFSRFPLADAKVVDLAGAGLPAIEASLGLDNVIMRLLCIHTLPPLNSEYAAVRNRMLDAIGERLNQWKGPRIVCGDFNCALWSPFYMHLIQATGLRNTRQGFGILPTWPAGLCPFMIPLDHCLVSSNITVTRCTVGPDFGSDHRPLLTELAIHE